MQKVLELNSFKAQVLKMARQPNAKLFHRYVCGNLFKISTAKRVQHFDFSSFTNEKEIMQFISVAIEILRKELPQQILLFDENCYYQKSDCTNDNLPTSRAVQEI